MRKKNEFQIFQHVSAKGTLLSEKSNFFSSKFLANLAIPVKM